MADKCKKCRLDISHTKDCFKCAECSAKFHLLCLSSASSEAAAKVGTRKTWKCEDCVSDMMTLGSRTGVESVKAAVLDAIADFRKETNERLDQSHKKLDNMRVDIINVSKDVSALKEQYSEVHGLSVKNSKDIEVLVSENKRLNDRVTALMSEVSDLQQNTRKSNIIISGVPLTPKENVYEVLNRIARLLDVRFERYDISAAHRLPVRRGDTRAPAIVVCFISRSIKTDWIASRKARKTLSAQELHASFPDQPVFINEHLTPQTRAIFNGARELIKSKELAAVWTNDGRVLAKRTVTGQPFRVLNLHQLEEMKGIAPGTTNPAVASNDR